MVHHTVLLRTTATSLSNLICINFTSFNGLAIFNAFTSLDVLVSTYFEQVAWEEETDTVWRTTEAGVEEEDKEV